ncbi:hypothetical protein HML84_19755 [Alcanivorax sp. IO_7]|nr:hypothetical protein HML84_19755 [Alcanivorax sp. IO_7]
MTVGHQGRAATLNNALSQAERFGLSEHEAAECVDAMKQVVEKHWKELFSAAGMEAGDIEYLAKATILSPSIFD